MAKGIYKVPVSIDRSRLDHEIVLESEKTGFRLKPMPVKVLLYWCAVIFMVFWGAFRSPISNGSFIWPVLFVIWAIPVAIYFGRQLGTKEFVFAQFPALLGYLPKAKRKLVTRRSSSPYDFMEMIGIRQIEENGLIHYLDGSVGRMYNVVGSASRLLFDQDRAAIIDRVDKFWRKIDTSSEFIIFDLQEPQRVAKQVTQLEARNQYLQKTGKMTPALMKLQEEQFDILTEQVGGKFNSIHQYLVIKSPNMNTLMSAHNVLRGEVQASQMMFKACVALDAEQTEKALGPIFGAEKVREQEAKRVYSK